MLKPAMPNHCASAALAPVSRYANCASYEIHYMDWLPAGEPVATVIAWHGLARTGRDMDALARFLAGQGYRVICPDTLGRGLSQWSRAPREEYRLRFYARLARELLDALALEQVHWVGTSMGGAIGTVCASGLFEPALRQRILTLTLNDNAPELAAAALERIKAYAGQPPVFATVAELEAFFRQAYKPYGWLSEAEWRKLTETSTRRTDDGRVTPHYDPAMIQQFTAHDNDYLIWEHYDALQIPVLLLRGVDSDLVLRPVAERMQQRGPGAKGLLTWLEIEGCGHAPALNVPAHFEAVLACLRQ
ncbi:MAG: alpha/beta hydrolase [Comamonas sp.]|jgi:pimeloyl-ACP methyl ester carboxylesterase|uniref:alpha/beta fold hydrolase n=1 Tax=Comamonas sp. TaxID=34028 RepID=UPI002833FB9C|nr:alpha/beta hydrolase [Comamonas sp.]MDR0215324.1 alpha/beta hydrolase [Comamonas sp.]